MNFGQEVYILPIENQERKQILFALLVIVLYLSPLFILGENAHIRVHDNLDSNIAWYKVLSESGELFGAIDAKIPQIMNGLPRNAFGSEFSIIVWLYALFPTMVAYAISQALTRFIAFFGMYILLKNIWLQGANQDGLGLEHPWPLPLPHFGHRECSVLLGCR